MGFSVALPAAMPRGGSRETTGEDPRDERGLTDGDLIGRVARRDANAFELLYRRYARPVFGLALRRLGDRMRAEDAVQETFAAVWRSARRTGRIAAPGHPGSTRSRATRSSTGAGTAASRRPRFPTPRRWSQPRPSAPRPRTSPGACTARSKGCPQKERDVIELAYYGELSQSEIADFLGIPLGTVKTRTRAGLSRLADLLEGELQ